MYHPGKKLALLATLGLLGGLAAAAPTAADDKGNRGNSPTSTACLVADTGGFADGTFNADALAGAERAARRFDVSLVTADPRFDAGITSTLDRWVSSSRCDLIIGVGFQVGALMEPFVAAHQDQRFAVLDYVSSSNGSVASILFAVNEPAFLAGYVAAAANDTGKVATYGGADFPSVTNFMNGYALGVDYFNARRGGDVEVLGWDVDSQSGVFTGDFQNPEAGYTVANDFFDQGADTVMPVAGLTGLGTYWAAVERKQDGEEVRVVYVDFDPFREFNGDQPAVLLTTVLKSTGVATYHQIQALARGTWAPGVLEEDLASGGVAIAPFHRTKRQVPAYVRSDLRKIRTGIINGSIPTLP